MKDLFKERLCRMEFWSRKRKKPRLNVFLFAAGPTCLGMLVEVFSKDLWENKAELATFRHPRLYVQQKVPQISEFYPLSLQQFSCCCGTYLPG